MLSFIRSSLRVASAGSAVRFAAAAAYQITVNGRKYNINDGKNKTVLQACQEAGVYVPYLCYHPALGPEGHCRLCVVEIEHEHVPIAPSCVTPLKDGMVIRTNTPKINSIVKTNLELLRARHPNNCLTCSSNGRCEFQDLIHRYNVEEKFPNVYRGNMVNHSTCGECKPEIDSSSNAIVRDMSKCVLCGRCVRACNEFQGMGVLGYVARAGQKMVSTPYDLPLNETVCVDCGRCASVCPVGAIVEKDAVHPVENLLMSGKEEGLVLVAQTAPAVRVAIGEEFNLRPDAATGKMVSALKNLGFDYVFDTNFTADLTILEEGTELIKRIKKGGPFPMFTSCCPAWVNMIEKMYPEYRDNLSTCKSPQGMMGAVIKHVFAKKLNIDPTKIRVVSVMPCTAKKDERARQALTSTFTSVDGKEEKASDVDHVLTTKELGDLIKQHQLPFASLPEAEFDNPLGESTGAAVIFGASGGVAEAALRTVSEVVTGKKLESVDMKALRGYEGIREATVKLGDLDVNVAIASGLKHAQKIMDLIKSGKKNYHFVEIMACPGGCINGGGQPKMYQHNTIKERNQVIYDIDAKTPNRKSHENTAVANIYEKYFGEPNSDKAHHLLHTHYTDRKTCMH